MTTKIIFGPPGTGKTTMLLGRIEDEINRGVEPQEIAFVSFTKAAVEEAVSRAMTKFGLSRRQLPWFRTLHSLAFSALGVAPDSMLTDYSDFSSESGVRFSKFRGEESLGSAAPDGDVFLSARALMSATGKNYEDVQRYYGITMSSFRFGRLSTMLDVYKKRVDRMEYHDLFTRYLAQCDPLNVRVAIVDEAQDLTPMQWHVVMRAFGNVERLYIAGDDDQAIYDWAGASPTNLLNIAGDQIVLDRSYRLPDNFRCFADQISGRIGVRKAKEWHGAQDREGQLLARFNWNDIDFTRNESWLLLVRANCFMKGLAEILERKGVVFSWHGIPHIKPEHARAFISFIEFEGGARLKGSAVLRLLDHSYGPSVAIQPSDLYQINSPSLANVRWMAKWPHTRLGYFRRVWNQQKSFDAKNSVELTTIHQAKGTEADNVVLSPDITATITSRMGDPEHRVFYVGATRAKRRLFMLNPQQEHFYIMPKPHVSA